MKKQLEAAAAWTAKNYPVNDHRSDPNLYRTEKSPPDLLYRGKAVAYYDTQLALWRLGDHQHSSPEGKAFASKTELLQTLKEIYPDQTWV